MVRAMGIALVLVGALVLAACGDDSDQSSASTTSATSTSTSTTTSTTTTTVPVEPGPYVGTWYNNLANPDNTRTQEIVIDGVAPSPEGPDLYSYLFSLVDPASDPCVGVVGSATPASGSGSFTAGTGEDAFVVEDFQFYCRLNGPDDEDWPLFNSFPMQLIYEPQADRLVQPPGDVGLDVPLCWTREPPGPTSC